MRIGDVVIPAYKGKPFRSGASSYTHAICVSLEPFIMVSEGTDMMWTSTITIDDVIFLCQAKPSIYLDCRKRAEKDGYKIVGNYGDDHDAIWKRKPNNRKKDGTLIPIVEEGFTR